jgi:hypothetical protein
MFSRIVLTGVGYEEAFAYIIRIFVWYVELKVRSGCALFVTVLLLK